MSVNMKDVADLAGVSLSTVSRVINDSNLVSNDTAYKVKKAIKELDYQINESARALRTNITNLVGIIGAGMDNPFLTKTLKSMEAEAIKENYNIIYGDSDGELEQELYYINMLKQKKVDGLIIITAKFSEELIEMVRSIQIPTIFASGYIKNPDLAAVTVNNVKAAEDVSDYLFNFSDHFGIIRGPYKDSVASEERMIGVSNKYREKNVKLKKKYISEGDFSYESGYKAAQKLFKNNNDLKSIFSFSDQMAIGAMRYCYDNNIQIPEEVSIVGFDDIEVARFTKPSLSTISQSGAELGVKSMKLLLKLMNNESITNYKEFVSHKLVIRESSKSINTIKS